MAVSDLRGGSPKFIGVGCSEYMEHTEKMACMQAHGEYAKGKCTFPAQK